ncbi:MAG: response regulator transcription factor [Calditrichaeota bacterium]|nr:response regulator transcription factor [Calditrichota bacterium]
MNNIILIEDEVKVAEFIRTGLDEAGYDVDVFHDGESGLKAALERTYDLYLLDWMLPGVDGLEICKQVRDKFPAAGIIMLTARDDMEDKISGLDQGADDYITKPFAFEELLARVRSLQRRASSPESNFLQVKNLRLDILKRKTWIGDKEIFLSNKEYDLLYFLMQHVDKLVTREMIAVNVWDIDFDTGTNYIDVYINYLRKKLNDSSKCPVIYTVRGTGYILKSKND